jgi:hypothetical protein
MWALPDLHQQRASGTLPPLRWLHEVASADVVEDLFWSDPLPMAAGLLHRLRRRTARARSESPPMHQAPDAVAS